VGRRNQAKALKPAEIRPVQVSEPVVLRFGEQLPAGVAALPVLRRAGLQGALGPHGAHPMRTGALPE
jgi:hypothetical protein